MELNTASYNYLIMFSEVPQGLKNYSTTGDIQFRYLEFLSFVIESEVVYETNPGLANCVKENCSIYCFIYEATKPQEFLSNAYSLIGKINFSRKLLLQLECI